MSGACRRRTIAPAKLVSVARTRQAGVNLLQFFRDEEKDGADEPREHRHHNRCREMQPGVTPAPAVGSAELWNCIDVVDAAENSEENAEGNEEMREHILDQKQPEKLLIAAEVFG